jgi:negative regulator of sigma E activity
MNGQHNGQHNGQQWNEELLSAYVDGECTAEERATVEARLAASPALRDVLAEIEAARAAVRALPHVDAPPEFWARLLDGTGLEPGDIAAVSEMAPAPESAPVVALAPRRHTSRTTRWLVAAGGAAAAAVIALVVLVPQPKEVDPPVASFTQAHNVRSSLDTDAVSSLAPLALQAGFRR